MRIPKRTLFIAATSLAIVATLAAALVAFRVGGARAATALSGTTRHVTLGGTTSPQAGDFAPSGDESGATEEFPEGEEADEGPDPYAGTISF